MGSKALVRRRHRYPMEIEIHSDGIYVFSRSSKVRREYLGSWPSLMEANNFIKVYSNLEPKKVKVRV